MKKNRVALVTEAGNSLGKVFAAILNKQGFAVILAAKGKRYQELEKERLKGIKLLKTDFTDPNSIEKLREYIEIAYGKLDVLINNAEIANGFGQKITELEIGDVREMFEENLFAAIRAIQGLYGLLIKSEKANIINVSSSLGQIEKMKDDRFCYFDYQMTGYSTSKSALEMLTVVLAKEFKHINISVDSFDPVRVNNCTHNKVLLCKKVEKELLDLLAMESPLTAGLV